MHEVRCPYCKHLCEYVSSACVYGGRDYGMIYLCRPCDAFCGVHKGTDEPLGSPANKTLRELRRKAHSMFDALWQEKLRRRRAERGPDYKKVWARGSAYKWLSEQTGIPTKKCHMGMMCADDCLKVIAVVQPHFERLGLRPSKGC